MHIAYSAIHQTAATQHQQNITEPDSNEPLLRYQAYQAACQKYQHEIAAIQKYLPDWMPAFKR